MAADDAAATDEDTPAIISVLGNDLDPDGDPLAVVGVTDGSYGTAVFNADHSITYTPSADFLRVGETVTDVITYTIDDGPGMGMATAQVTIMITGVNDVPVAALNVLSTLGEYSVDGIDDVTFDVNLAYDLENEPLSFTWLVNGILLDPQPEGSTFLVTAADLFDLREFVSDSNTITVKVSDGIDTVVNSMTLTFDTAPPGGAFASSIPAPTDWDSWGPAGNDLDVSGRSNVGDVQNKLSKFNGEWALSTIPQLEPGGAIGPPLPEERKLGFDFALRYQVSSPGAVHLVQNFPLTTPAQLARINIRANLQRLKQDIVDKIDCLLTFSAPYSTSPSIPIPMTEAERVAVMNEVADVYIRGVDNFLETHPGAKPSLDRRNKVLRRLGLENSVNSPWCADWAQGMLSTVVSPLGVTNVTTQAFLSGGDAKHQTPNYQHNWVYLCGESRVSPYDVTNVTDEMKSRMVYLDPWQDLMPRIYFASAFNYTTTSLNEGFGP